MSDTPTPTPLTPVERTILALIRDGAHDAEIAVRVGIPIGDLKQRIERLVARSGVRDRAALGALSEADILSRVNERQAWRPDGAEDGVHVHRRLGPCRDRGIRRARLGGRGLPLLGLTSIFATDTCS